MSELLDIVHNLNRLAELRRAALLDTPPEEPFDRLTRLATRLCRTPVGLVSLVDRDRQFFKSVVGLPEPWQGTIEASLRLIDELEHEIGDCEAELRTLGADHCYVPLLRTVPGIGWVLAYTIAAEIGDMNRFPTPRKLAGYSGLCPRVYQSGERDLRGPLSKQGPRYLRWALVEAATHACTHPHYRERYQQTKTRIGKQRGAKVAQIDLARRLAEAIWHMLTRKQSFAPKGATDPLAA